MNYKLIFLCIALLSINFAIAQTTIRKVIVDAETNLPISNAHIYGLDQYKSGTISNLDGRFVMKLQGDDMLCISHVSYFPEMLNIESIQSDTIFMHKKEEVIQEVLVQEVSAKEILRNVIENLEQNYGVEPIVYNAYIHVARFEKDLSELHVLSEYITNIHQNEKGKLSFELLKVRAHPFSKAGRAYFDDMRMMHGITLHSDNPLIHRKDYLIGSKLKKYNVEFTNELINASGQYIEITCTPKKVKSYTSVVMLIDKESYGIKRIVRYYGVNEEHYEDIVYKKIDNKWYLQSSKWIAFTDFFNLYTANSYSVISRQVIYNIGNFNYDKSKYRTWFDLVAEHINPHLGEWSESYWEDYNYIVLPEWIQKIVREQTTDTNLRMKHK